MAEVSEGIAPIIPLDRGSTFPLHRQIYEGFRAAIVRNDLRAGQRIPSSRDLASELGVSRIPVLNAYAQLVAEGYFESRVGAGTYVSSLPDLVAPSRPSYPPAPDLLSGPRPVSRQSSLYPRFQRTVRHVGWGAFGVHQPAFDHFPFKLWSKLVLRHSRSPRVSVLHRIDPMGYEPLREAVCEYLRTARAVRCDPDQVMIVSGSQQALDLCARVLFDPGNHVWVEEPGYWLARSAFIGAGCRPVPVPVDPEGINVAAGIKLCPKARAAHVTPSHQYPLGVMMSASRRMQLLNWAQRAGSWILEDDYDSEYRYESQPVASLQGLDQNARVIYVGTFSKVLFPSLRLGYLVCPRDLTERFAALRYSTDIFPPYLNQAVLTDFMRDGDFARHIRRMRQLYKERRTTLVESLGKELGTVLEVHGREAGMHLAVTLPNGFRDVDICKRAEEKRLWLWPLSPSYLAKPAHHGFILGFGSTTTAEIPRAVRRLRELVNA
jgi:GntR family transcriptional regulator / MocR family aminotransferase